MGDGDAGTGPEKFSPRGHSISQTFFDIQLQLCECAPYRTINCLLWVPSSSMNISKPVASFIERVDFGFLSSEEIKALSVKTIHNPVTFDTLLHPVSGGLYDPSLGAWSDNP